VCRSAPWVRSNYHVRYRPLVVQRRANVVQRREIRLTRVGYGVDVASGGPPTRWELLEQVIGLELPSLEAA